MQSVHDFIGSRLRPLSTDLPRGWQLWQQKSLNLHRGVIHWQIGSAKLTLPEIRDRVRTVVREQFRPRGFRGFGFGVVLSLTDVDDSLKHAGNLVDVRNNSQGVWQWIVLHLPEVRAAAGICTWSKGYLSSVYDGLLASLHDSGYDCESHQKDMDAFMKRLTAIQNKLSVARLAIGGLGILD